MKQERKLKNRMHRRVLRVRKGLRNNTSLPRVSVFRSLNHIYAQVIDDNAHATIISCSSLELKDTKGDKKKIAHSVGLELANRAKDKGVQAVRFDRGRYLYHGRIKALSEGLREGGLNI